MYLLSKAVVFASIVLVSIASFAADPEPSFAVRSSYLSSPLEGYFQVMISGAIKGSEGRGNIMLDPNECEVNEFGDPNGCTKIATSSYPIKFSLMRTQDPLGLDRQLWLITGTPLNGPCFLVVKKDAAEDMKLVHTTRGGSHVVVPLTRSHQTNTKNTGANEIDSAAKKNLAPFCSDLKRTVDGTKATAELHAGIFNGTYLLFLNGKKPNANTWIAIEPLTYVEQPDYWVIRVRECRLSEVALPSVTFYTERDPFDVSDKMGKKGIQVEWADGESEKINK